jgi:hypothetical protein
MTWPHQPATLPRSDSRDRMMYVTIMDHMVNSASHAYYNQGAMQVQVAVKQVIMHILFNNYITSELVRAKPGSNITPLNSRATNQVVFFRIRDQTENIPQNYLKNGSLKTFSSQTRCVA